MASKDLKIFWFDVETTGLNPVKNDIIQIAAIVEINKKIEEEFDLYIKPFTGSMVSTEELDINKRSIEEIRNFPDPYEQYLKIISVLSKYVSRYDNSDKFLVGGQNPKFDIDFLRQFFIKNGDIYFGSWFNYHHIDTTCIGAILKYFKNAELENVKLESICNLLGIEIDAHDALSDIRATREIFLKFGKDYLK